MFVNPENPQKKKQKVQCLRKTIKKISEKGHRSEVILWLKKNRSIQLNFQRLQWRPQHRHA